MKPIRLSAHALSYITKRGFTVAEVEETIRNGKGEQLGVRLSYCLFMLVDPDHIWVPEDPERWSSSIRSEEQWRHCYLTDESAGWSC
jgi:hypothetical protein